MRRTYSKEIDDQIILLRQQGLKSKDIATQLDVPLTKVLKLFRIRGIKLDKELLSKNLKDGRKQNTIQYDPVSIAQILPLRQEGMSIPNICKQLNLPKNKVVVVLRDLNYTISEEQAKQNQIVSAVKFTEEQRKEVVAQRLVFKTMQEIAKSTGLSEYSVKYILQDNDIVLSKEGRKVVKDKTRLYTSDIEAEIVKLRDQGLVRKEIANRLNINYTKVINYLKEKKHTVSKEIKVENARVGKIQKDDDRVMRWYGVKTRQDLMVKLAEGHKGFCLGTYEGNKVKLQWKCAKGHFFLAQPNFVQQGGWCAACANVGPSAAQIEIYEYVLTIAPDAILDDNKTITPKDIDILVPGKLAIEYDGLFWHSSGCGSYYNGREQDKYELVNNAGLKYLMIYQDEWSDSIKKEIIKKMIAWRIGKFNGTKLHVRDCEIRPVTFDEAFDFFEFNHLEGYTHANEVVGLYWNETLVMAAAFRNNSRGEYELARMATNYDYSVRGGASKLLKGKNNLISFSSNRIGNGEVYRQSGFKEITPKSSKPGYWYTDGNIRYSRWDCQRINDPEVLALYPTEYDQALAGLFSEGKKLHRIEDCGNKKWLLSNTPINLPNPVQSIESIPAIIAKVTYNENPNLKLCP